MSYKPYFDKVTGKLSSVQRLTDLHWFFPNDAEWPIFLAWNAAQPTPFNLADKPADKAVQRSQEYPEIPKHILVNLLRILKTNNIPLNQNMLDFLSQCDAIDQKYP